MGKPQAYQSVRRHLRQWERALADVDAAHAKFGVAGEPGADIHAPPIGTEGAAEIRRAENRAMRQWEELQESVERWNGMVLKSSPPLQEILKTLRANMPALKAEYGVTSLAVIGPYAKGDDYEASQLDLMIDFAQPPGLKFFGMGSELSELLGVKVHVVTKSVIAERKPHLLNESAPV